MSTYGHLWGLFSSPERENSTGNGIVTRSSTHEIRTGRSKKITGPYLDADGKDLATGGGTLLLQSEGDRVGPGHPCFITRNGGTRMIFHYYDRRRNGFATLGDLPLRWTESGWPEIKEDD